MDQNIYFSEIKIQVLVWIQLVSLKFKRGIITSFTVTISSHWFMHKSILYITLPTVGGHLSKPIHSQTTHNSPLGVEFCSYFICNRPISQIPQRTCRISHNMHHSEQKRALFWMVYCGIWDRCILGFVILVYTVPGDIIFIVSSAKLRYQTNRSISQISHCIRQISHSALLCNRNVLNFLIALNLDLESRHHNCQTAWQISQRC